MPMRTLGFPLRHSQKLRLGDLCGGWHAPFPGRSHTCCDAPSWSCLCTSDGGWTGEREGGGSVRSTRAYQVRCAV